MAASQTQTSDVDSAVYSTYDEAVAMVLLSATRSRCCSTVPCTWRYTDNTVGMSNGEAPGSGNGYGNSSTGVVRSTVGSASRDFLCVAGALSSPEVNILALSRGDEPGSDIIPDVEVSPARASRCAAPRKKGDVLVGNG